MLNQMMMGMLPPGMQQLFDLLPTPEAMRNVVRFLREEDWKPDEVTADSESVAAFLDQLSQVLIQQEIAEEAAQQTEPLKLWCPTCGKDFAVAKPLQYRHRVAEGILYGCAGGVGELAHEPTAIGSGRNGSLTPDEALIASGDYQLKVIFPAEYNEDNGNA